MYLGWMVTAASDMWHHSSGAPRRSLSPPLYWLSSIVFVKMVHCCTCDVCLATNHRTSVCLRVPVLYRWTWCTDRACATVFWYPSKLLIVKRNQTLWWKMSCHEKAQLSETFSPEKGRNFKLGCVGKCTLIIKTYRYPSANLFHVLGTSVLPIVWFQCYSVTFSIQKWRV